jgi:hypothetical protein
MYTSFCMPNTSFVLASLIFSSLMRHQRLLVRLNLRFSLGTSVREAAFSLKERALLGRDDEEEGGGRRLSSSLGADVGGRPRDSKEDCDSSEGVDGLFMAGERDEGFGDSKFKVDILGLGAAETEGLPCLL